MLSTFAADESLPLEYSRFSIMAILQSVLLRDLQAPPAAQGWIESIFLSIQNLQSAAPILLGAYFADQDGIPLVGEILCDRPTSPQSLKIQFTPSEIPLGSAFIGFFVVPLDDGFCLNVGDWIGLSCDEDGAIALHHAGHPTHVSNRISLSTPCFEIGNFQQSYDDVAIALLKNLHANQVPITLGGAEFLAIYEEQHQPVEEWIDFVEVASFVASTSWTEAVKLKEKVVYL